MQIQKIVNGDQYPPENVSGTNQELLDQTVAVSNEDGGCHAVLGEFNNLNNEPPLFHAFASKGELVKHNLTV